MTDSASTDEKGINDKLIDLLLDFRRRIAKLEVEKDKYFRQCNPDLNTDFPLPEITENQVLEEIDLELKKALKDKGE